jgi:3-methylfumaryl-CoA hydratase
VGAEEQDIVYRSEPPGTEPRVLGRTVPARGDNNPPKPPRRDSGGGEPEPEGDWRLSLDTDPVLLFRFSALTYNGHRIHYDRDYATSAEGYPERVIHGPLLALLALELPRLNAPGKTVTSFEYRLTRPAFLPSRLVSAGGPGGDSSGNEATLAVAAVGAAPSLTAKATLA